MSRLEVLVNNADGGSGVSSEDVERAVRATLETGFISRRAPASVEISVTLLPADRMQDLNREYHDVDAPTDVLAFELGGDGREAGALLADVYVCPDTAAEAASERGLETDAELLRLVVHGVLHLLGHDHPAGDDRYESPMFRLQEAVLSGLGSRQSSGGVEPRAS